MISYVTIGTNDLERGAKFYDAVLGVLGATRKLETETFISWATDAGGAMVSLNKPFDGNAATAGNGMMVALIQPVPSRH